MGLHKKNEGNQVVCWFNYGFLAKFGFGVLEIRTVAYSRFKLHRQRRGTQLYNGNEIFYSLFPIVYVALM